jgi:glutamate N-acetyltransferase / amino-acid N-acetyltransferase
MRRPTPLERAALPAGFSVYGIRCGLSSRPGKKDLALFVSDRPASAGAVFTQNQVKAAPVLLSQAHLRSSKAVRAVLINSGCANACTGGRGLRDAQWSARLAAAGLGVRPRQVLVASTGVIGRYLLRRPLQRGVDAVVRLARQGGAGSVKAALEAIMTTDTRPKAAAARFAWRGRAFTVWGCAKGAGMIHPRMATMLSVLLTDIGLPRPDVQSALAGAAQRTFNRLSVDGDTSTNDTVFLLANGASGIFSAPARALRRRFRAAVQEVCLSLSRQIAADGEGATRTAWIFVQGARTEAAAERMAEVVATSALVKTALHGADPNWGRIMAALGRSGVPFDPGRVDIRIGSVLVCRRGQAVDHSERAAHKALQRPSVPIIIDLRQGSGQAYYLTCDYSKEYISINADYTT